jgi:putative FmdB family regulatory protein
LPLYEYQCTQCGYRYEKIQKFDAEADAACPKCGGELYRPLTAPALQFKGAGWYVNDYAPKGGGTSTSDKPAGEAGGENKSPAESKPASEAKPAATESTPKPATAPSTTPTSS